MALPRTQATPDMEVTPGPTDGISSLAWSPAADLLAASSWDNQVRVWEMAPNGTTSLKITIPHTAPPLCTAWSKDGTKLFSCGAEKAIKVMDTTTGQIMPIPGAHDAPISACNWMEGPTQQVLVTGSWDKTIKYWDFRSPSAIATVALPEKVYAMDLVYPLLAVATAELHVCIFDLNNPTRIWKTRASPLKFQTRTIACWNDAKGYAIGSIEGRCGIEHIDDAKKPSNFSFKCHREGTRNVYAVNSIAFHPVYGTFATAGSDGTYSFWDKDIKQRLKSGTGLGTQISAAKFNRTGQIFAYALSYDWSKGHMHSLPNAKNAIYLHASGDDEIKPKAKKR